MTTLKSVAPMHPDHQDYPDRKRAYYGLRCADYALSGRDKQAVTQITQVFPVLSQSFLA